MKIEKRSIYENDSENLVTLKELYNKRSDEAAEMEQALNDENNADDFKEQIRASLDNIYIEADKIGALIEEEEKNETRNKFNPIAAFSFNGGEVRGESMKNNTKEIRSFQKYLNAGAIGMTETEVRGLNLNASAAAIPKEIYEELVTSTKWSDLLHRAKIFENSNAGNLSIPIANDTLGAWHEELSEGEEKAPILTNIVLGGYELMRLTKVSASTFSMSTPSFIDALLSLLDSEVVQTLEKSFIDGDGDGKPKGLINLTWNENNSVTTESSETKISMADIAKAIGELPAKYARNCVLLMNTKTAYEMTTLAAYANGTPVFPMTESVGKILGKEIVLSEHCPDDTVFVVDPGELYVRFSSPIQCEADHSSGFTSATVNVRALTVVDAAWNPAACIKVAVALAD